MSHFYTREGESAHEGGLAEARKQGYFPSVTTIARIINNEGINRYRETQMLMAALTLPRRSGETDGEFADRVIDDAREHSREAAETGRAVHEVLETYWNSGIFHAGSLPPPLRLSAPAIREALSAIGRHGWAEVSFANHHLGYGGRIDFFGYDDESTPVVLDYKTQGVKESLKSGLPKFTVYPEWAMQLAAYRHAVSQIPGFEAFCRDGA